MNKITSILLLATALLAADPAAAREARTTSKKVKPRITHEGLQQQQAATLPDSAARAVTARELQPTVPRSQQERGSLIARSAIISSGINWTIVPKEAILHVPGHFRARLNGKRSGRLLPWKDFLIKNRNWILVEEVNLDQASGKVALDEKIAKKHQNLGRLVVAVCKGGPISVKAPRQIPVAAHEARTASPGQ